MQEYIIFEYTRNGTANVIANKKYNIYEGKKYPSLLKYNSYYFKDEDNKEIRVGNIIETRRFKIVDENNNILCE